MSSDEIERRVPLSPRAVMIETLRNAALVRCEAESLASLLEERPSEWMEL